MKAIDTIKQMSRVPGLEEEYRSWISLHDAIPFLQADAASGSFTLYASLPYVFIHTILSPSQTVAASKEDDFFSWQCNAYETWGVSIDFTEPPTITLERPLQGSGSEFISNGEKLIYARQFSGSIGNDRYIELSQRFVHVTGLHFVDERSAYSYFNEDGDIEDAVNVIRTEDDEDFGTIVTVKRDILDRYMFLTSSAAVRMFDFTRFDLHRFGGWHDSHEADIVRAPGIRARLHFEPYHAGFLRGSQIVDPAMSLEDFREYYHPVSTKSRQYAAFIINDWKNGKVTEVSCAPGASANYFTKSSLPFELSPAFFRPEVLAKYKNDSDKYSLEDRTITCREAWHLQNYDINEAGQVHTYLVYLRTLPYSEQLHWKAYNEQPKSGISKRAMLSDFEGSWDLPYDPMQCLKDKVRQLHEAKALWWKLRSEKSLERARYPVTASADEWAAEIMNLDQLIVEGFEEKWFKAKLKENGLEPLQGARSLGLTKQWLEMRGMSADEATALIAPIKALHDLRTKLKGHAASENSVRCLQRQALKEHKTFAEHFRNLCEQIDHSFGVISSHAQARVAHIS